MKSSIPALAQRHPEWLISSLAGLAALAVFVTHLDVCWPSPSRTEQDVDRAATRVRELLRANPVPRVSLPGAAAGTRWTQDRPVAPRPLGDWTGYPRTVIDIVEVLTADPDRKLPRRHDRVQLPTPIVQTTANPAPVSLAWNFGDDDVALPAGTSVTIHRTQVRGSDGASVDHPSERLLATLAADARTWQDADAAAGCTYAYRVELGYRDQRESSSAVNLTVPLPIRFRLLGLSDGVAMVQVEKYFGPAAGWRRESFRVRSGDAVGGVLATTIPGIYGRLDFSTDYVVRDIRQEHRASLHGFSRNVPVVELASPQFGRQVLFLAATATK